MKNILGVLIIIAGIALGLYLGVWLMFIGGIAQIINAVKATPVEAMGIALGLAKFFFSSLVGWVTFFVFVGIGAAMID